MTKPWTMSLLVGLGGFAGSVARFGLSVMSQRFPSAWPLGTLAANILGCFLIGTITELSAVDDTISPEVRLALATGFCGGFTTLSSLIYETAEMLRASENLHATLYVSGTFLLSMVAFVAGLMAARVVTRMGRGLWN